MAKKPPLAQSPLVALAEQANVADVEHAILVVRTKNGERMVWPLADSDPDILVGIMAWATTTILLDLPDDED